MYSEIFQQRDTIYDYTATDQDTSFSMDTDLEHPKPTSRDPAVQLLISILTGTPLAITITDTEILVGKRSFPSSF